MVPKIPGDLAYVLDLNMYSMNDNVPSTEAILDWLEAAHERIGVAFNASFTEKAHYELFGEINK